MPLDTGETSAQFVRRALAEAQAEEASPAPGLRKMTLRLPQEAVAALDYLGSLLRLSRTAVAEELLTRAAMEAVGAVSDGDD